MFVKWHHLKHWSFSTLMSGVELVDAGHFHAAKIVSDENRCIALTISPCLPKQPAPARVFRDNYAHLRRIIAAYTPSTLYWSSGAGQQWSETYIEEMLKQIHFASIMGRQISSHTTMKFSRHRASQQCRWAHTTHTALTCVLGISAVSDMRRETHTSHSPSTITIFYSHSLYIARAAA